LDVFSQRNPDQLPSLSELETYKSNDLTKEKLGLKKIKS